MDFSGKIGLVTGGAAGIGLTVAKGFLSGGGKVVLIDRDTAVTEVAARLGSSALGIVADVSLNSDVEAYVRAALSAFGRIDCLVNNAGYEGKIAPTAEYDEADWDQVIAVNLKGTFLGLRHVLPVMIALGSGSIVNVASSAGVIGTPRMPAYSASKHAVVGLTKTVAGEVGFQGIRVNCVCPGATDTKMLRSVEKMINPGHPDALRNAYQGDLPAGRYATKEEISNVILFLLSQFASAVSGAHYLADSGGSQVGAVITNRA